MLGGLERISEIVARSMSQRGNEVTVVTEAVLGSSRELTDSFEVLRRPSRIQLFRRFRRSDVILFFGFSLRAVPLGMLSGTPIVVSHHGVYSSSGWRRFSFSLKRTLMRRLANIAVSEFVAGMLGVPAIVIPNAYDDEAFVNEEAEREYDAVFFGRLVSEKGADLFLRAIAVAAVVRPDLRAAVVGEGPERSYLEREASALKLTPPVRFLGALSPAELNHVLNVSHVAVLPSRGDEGFGIAALEALACGCQVIVSSRGGLPEAVGEVGIVVSPEPHALAEALINALSSRPMPTALVDAHLQRHKPAHVVSQYEAVLKRALTKSRV
jgi:glycogen synthase